MPSNEATLKPRAVQHYLSQRLLGPARVQAMPASDLRLVITIPSHDEPDLATTMRALANCEALTVGSVEVLILINAAAQAAEDVRQRNRLCYTNASSLAEHLSNNHLRFHVRLDNTLTGKHVGVGLARKLVMDEALQRLDHVNATSGVIAAMDADCVCDPNYLQMVDAAFSSSDLAGVSINFEHPLDDPQTREAVAHYELFLRHYRLGLLYARSTHAFHTVGSSMAVRAQDYAALGGMNRRQAGEDFYFLQKFMDTGRFATLNATTVRPSARESHRVPFGTGAAIHAAIHEQRTMALYHPDIFADLRQFFEQANVMYSQINEWRQQLPPALVSFLDGQGFAAHLSEIRANVASSHAFEKRLRLWMNGFRCMKYTRFATTEIYPPVSRWTAATTLLEWLGYSDAARLIASPTTQAHELIEVFRTVDRRT